MELKMEFKFDREKIVSKIAAIWKKIYLPLFFVSIASAIIFGWYVWNVNLQTATWSDAKKQKFINAQDKGVVFNENDFKKALEVVEKRSQQNANLPEAGKNFFKAY